MMLQTHKIFSIWLLYITVVIFAAGAFVFSGIPKLALFYDHSHLTFLLVGMYIFAEILSGRQAWKISNEHRIAMFTHSIDKIDDLIINTENITLKSGSVITTLPSSILTSHIKNLWNKAKNGATKPIDQRLLLEYSEEKLHEQISLTEFISSKIVWLGIFATILGVIMAFWPLLNSGFDLEAMKQNIGGFFGGIAVAFIPTAASFIFKIILDINDGILTRGVSSTIAQISRFSETVVIPYLER